MKNIIKTKYFVSGLIIWTLFITAWVWATVTWWW